MSTRGDGAAMRADGDEETGGEMKRERDDGATRNSAVIIPHTQTNLEDWSRYADDPNGWLNRRVITREERRRQFQVSVALGDSKLVVERMFKPWLSEEGASEVKHASGEKRGVDQLRWRWLVFFASRNWDKAYLGFLGLWLVLLPAAAEGDFGLGCHSAGYDRLADRGPGGCLVLWPPLALMTVFGLPPLIGAFALRIFGYAFLKRRGGERRHWGLFFVLALKSSSSPLQMPVEFKEYFRELCGRSTVEKRAKPKFAHRRVIQARDDGQPLAIVAGAPPSAEAPADASAAPGAPETPTAENVVVEKKTGRLAAKASSRVLAGFGDAPGTPPRSAPPSPQSSPSTLSPGTALSPQSQTSPFFKLQKQSKKPAASDFERLVRWDCVACGRGNAAPLVGKTDTRVFPKRIQRLNGQADRIVAVFEHEPHRPRCNVCATPINYNPRKSNADKFFPATRDALRATSLFAAAKVERENEMRTRTALLRAQAPMQQMQPPQETSAPRTDEAAPIPPAAAPISPAARPLSPNGREETAAQYVQRMIREKELDDGRFSIRNFFKLFKCKPLLRFCRTFCRTCCSNPEAVFDTSKMIFNDYTFEASIAAFKPAPPRQYSSGIFDKGDLVESFYHMPSWYPAVVRSRNDNGSYVLDFDNGERADAVEALAMRYRIPQSVSAMQQFLSACFLCLLVMWPAWLAAYFSDVAFRRLGRGGLLVPPLVFCVFAVGGLYLQLFLLFLREREAGRAFFCKMAIFYGIAPLLLILLVGSALQESREPYASLLLLTMFCGASAVVASTIKIIYKYQVLKATPPIILFAILLSQHRARLPILVGPLGPLRGRLYVVFAPAFVLFGMACWLHIHLPYLWEATFYTQKLDRALLRPPADDQAKDSEDEGPVEL